MDGLKINLIEFINVLIALCLLMVLRRKRDPVTLLLVLFVCGTVHFSFAAIALATGEARRLLIELHIEGGGLLARLSTLTILIVAFNLLGRRAYDAYLSGGTGEKRNSLVMLLLIAVLICGYLLNYRANDILQLKNVVMIVAMFLLVMLGYLATIDIPDLRTEKVYAWGLVGLIMLVLINGVALYEVVTQNSWAGFWESSGIYVYRASSIFFNPNLYAFWASLLYLVCAYGMHAYREYVTMWLLGMVLVSSAIYLSGSRSAGYLLLVLLFLPSVLIKERVACLPLIVLPLTMLSIYGVSIWLAGDAVWKELILLGSRFAIAPIHLVDYIFQPNGLPTEVVVSIEGRFVGQLSDSGWLVLYQDAGWVGLSSVVLASSLLVLRGIRAYMAKPCPGSVYTLVALIYCLISGLVMRIQIFPVWLFIGLALIFCMRYWRLPPIDPEKAGG